MNEEGYTICAGCENLFTESELNEYYLCPDCEEKFQAEKKAIQDTEDSLQNFR